MVRKARHVNAFATNLLFIVVRITGTRMSTTDDDNVDVDDVADDDGFGGSFINYTYFARMNYSTRTIRVDSTHNIMHTKKR